MHVATMASLKELMGLSDELQRHREGKRERRKTEVYTDEKPKEEKKEGEEEPEKDAKKPSHKKGEGKGAKGGGSSAADGAKKKKSDEPNGGVDASDVADADRQLQKLKKAAASGEAPAAAAADGKKKEEEKKAKKEEEKPTRRETQAQREQVMHGLEPVQQLLQLGILPIEADAAVWNDFGTLTNKKVEIRASKINRILGAYEVGRGLFACQDFALNEIITVYGGELITTEEARLRKENAGSQSRRYLMRISDSDFLVDGWHYASGITDAPGDDDIFLPSDQNATQWMQGAGPMANHANDANSGVNASLSFVPLANSEALRLLPRIPTLRANRPIKSGEEICFNYGNASLRRSNRAIRRAIRRNSARNSAHFADGLPSAPRLVAAVREAQGARGEGGGGGGGGRHREVHAVRHVARQRLARAGDRRRRPPRRARAVQGVRAAAGAVPRAA